MNSKDDLRSQIKELLPLAPDTITAMDLGQKFRSFYNENMTDRVLKDLDLELNALLRQIAVFTKKDERGRKLFSRKVDGDPENCDEEDKSEEKDVEEENPKGPKKSTNVCWNWMQGSCTYKNCKFLHPPNVKGSQKGGGKGKSNHYSKGYWKGGKGGWGYNW